MNRLHAKRGKELPHTVLDEKSVKEIRQAAMDRAEMRRKITEEMSNDALARRYGVHPRTIEKVLSYETHIQVY